MLGLGRAGSAIARFLMKLGAAVYGHDSDQSVLSGQAVKQLRQAGMVLAPKPEVVKADWAVVSPGISEDNEAVVELRRRGVPVVDELDLASQFVPGPIVAVTGSNGKSTTTALIGHILEVAGHRVFVGGNLAPGRPLSAALDVGPYDWYVVEASSFQLERAQWFAPAVAVILNVSPDHLDRHRSLAVYAECKFRILDHQSMSDWAVLNHDDSVVMKARGRGKADRRFFSMRRPVCGAYRSGGWLYFEGERIAPVSEMKLCGAHNVANALAAVCVARIVGTGVGAIRRGLAGFAGLPHRLERVRVLAGVEYVNNSMCTNPAAGIKSLEAFRRKVVLITGGREKGLPVADYVQAVARRAKQVILCGENAPKLGRALARAGFKRFQSAASLVAAVRAAKAIAQAGDVVLFSPAFASFDQFRDFQERGDAFRKEVRRLKA